MTAAPNFAAEIDRALALRQQAQARGIDCPHLIAAMVLADAISVALDIQRHNLAQELRP